VRNHKASFLSKQQLLFNNSKVESTFQGIIIAFSKYEYMSD